MPKKALKDDVIKGLFCLETHTWGEPKAQASIEPTLQLLDKYWDVPQEARYVHHSVATKTELLYCLSEYCDPDSDFDTHPILILSFHGFSADKGEYPGIYVGNEHNGESVNLDTIAECMEGGCENRIIYFSSCSTMKVDKRRLQAFLKKTGALAVCGYKQSIAWVASAAFEVMFLGMLQSRFDYENYGGEYDLDDYQYGYNFTLPGMKGLVEGIDWFAPRLRDRLGFRMVLREPKGKN